MAVLDLFVEAGYWCSDEICNWKSGPDSPGDEGLAYDRLVLHLASQHPGQRNLHGRYHPRIRIGDVFRDWPNKKWRLPTTGA